MKKKQKKTTTKCWEKLLVKTLAQYVAQQKPKYVCKEIKIVTKNRTDAVANFLYFCVAYFCIRLIKFY